MDIFGNYILYFQDKDNNLKLVPIPPNQETVNILFGTNITTEDQMDEWLKQRRPKLDGEPKNGEEMSLSRVGKDLYEKVSARAPRKTAYIKSLN